MKAGVSPRRWRYIADQGTIVHSCVLSPISGVYRGKLLANIACLGKDRKTEWYSNTFKMDSLGGTAWSGKFHIWRMDWTAEYIALYCDEQLLNKFELSLLNNKDGSEFNPFKQPHYMLLNLAIGGQNGGDPSKADFPKKFEVDYVRVYQKSNN